MTLVLQRGEVVLVTDGTSSSCRGTAIFVVLPVRSTKKMYCNCPLLQYKHGVDFQHSVLQSTKIRLILVEMYPLFDTVSLSPDNAKLNTNKLVQSLASYYRT